MVEQVSQQNVSQNELGLSKQADFSEQLVVKNNACIRQNAPSELATDIFSRDHENRINVENFIKQGFSKPTKQKFQLPCLGC
ncbi:hypothetical protein [Colwellia sp. MEBiC06753]